MGVRLGVLSTYPSTQCGIATFSEALVRHLRLRGGDVGVVQIVDQPEEPRSPVVHQWVTGAAGAIERAATALDEFDVVLVQHEYGIFGGTDGSDVLRVLARVDVPIISVLHTVLTEPSRQQWQVLARLCQRSSHLVTMTEAARQRLIAGWDVEPSRVSVITHGAEENRTPVSARPDPRAHRATILTWGLIGKGKGIEWALRALAELDDLRPAYRVVGQTHPRVLEHEGEAYRDELIRLTQQLGLTSQVSFDARYLPGAALRRIVREADVILLPYDSREQVTSGVLTEAVAAGKPVVSTSFPHAVELLSSGAGLLVPQRDPIALAHALRRVLTEEGLAGRMAATSQRLADSLLWPAVATAYLELAKALVEAPAVRVAS